MTWVWLVFAILATFGVVGALTDLAVAMMRLAVAWELYLNTLHQSETPQQPDEKVEGLA